MIGESAEEALGTVRERLLLESLPLLASYAWKGSSPLEPTVLGIDDTLSIHDFLREFRMRHALACAAELVEVLKAIEVRPSVSSGLVRHESRGEVRGRLDVQRYVARGYNRMSHPRRYPVVQNVRNWRTPENELAALAIDEVVRALRENPFPPDAMETKTASELLNWATRRRYFRPWDDMGVTRSSERLRAEVRTRVRRRQTGNEAAYHSLLSWYSEWCLEPDRFGNVSAALGRGLLAFPAGEAFWNRTFEVWCLTQVLSQLREMGWTSLTGPRPLHSANGIVAAFAEPGGRTVLVRFQQRDPVLKARWTYRDGVAMAGVPDISLSSPGRVPVLIIDAKNRWVNAEGIRRSEESYKMLGYAENYADHAPFFRGILMFPSSASHHKILDGPNLGRLDLIAISVLADRRPAMSGLRHALDEWVTDLM